MDCLLGERKRCTDVDVWFRCAPAEAMAKLARIYEACAEVVAGIGSCKNLLVTRTTYSLIILTSDRSITPLQVPAPINLFGWLVGEGPLNRRKVILYTVPSMESLLAPPPPRLWSVGLRL